MKKLLHEIRQQSLVVRHVFMWSMVAITFSVVGALWFHQTREDVVALLNPADQPQPTSALAAREEPASPFATLRSSFSDLRANISELLSGSADPDKQTQPEHTVAPQRLPVQ